MCRGQHVDLVRALLPNRCGQAGRGMRRRGCVNVTRTACQSNLHLWPIGKQGGGRCARSCAWRLAFGMSFSKRSGGVKSKQKGSGRCKRYVEGRWEACRQAAVGWSVGWLHRGADEGKVAGRRLRATVAGKYILSGSLDSAVRLWDFEKGKAVKRYSVRLVLKCGLEERMGEAAGWALHPWDSGQGKAVKRNAVRLMARCGLEERVGGGMRMAGWASRLWESDEGRQPRQALTVSPLIAR
eukprot:365502-Chlamydomonas_euryale.AAC.3